MTGYFTTSACSWAEAYCQVYGCSISRSSSIVGCSEGQEGCRAVERRVTHPEATVSGALECGTPGSGGWCRGGGELGLSGSEPLAGYEILALEGTRNGEGFACPGASCSIPLMEGWNEFSYWALSSWGDSSRMGSTSGGLDSRAPSLAGEAGGTPGEEGWYVSEVTLTASASDPAPGSGLAGLEVSLDGGGWAAYVGPLVLYDGAHSVELRASDVAGNTASLSQTISVDTGAPAVAMSAAAAFCPRCGEALEISVSAQDGVSGVAVWRLSADSVEIAGGSNAVDQIVSWDGGGISGGAHTLTMWAADAAGNASEASQPLTVEVPPAPASEPTSAAPLILAPPSSPTATVTRTPAPTRTAATFSFGGLPAAPPPEEGDLLPAEPPDDPAAAPAAGTGGGSGVLWGGAALALIGLVTAFVLEQAQRRKQEEAAERAEMLKANAEAEVRDQALLAWQAAVAWAAKQEAERLAQEQADEQASAAAVAAAAMDQMWGEEDKSLKAFVQAKLAEARRLQQAVEREASVHGVLQARDGGVQNAPVGETLWWRTLVAASRAFVSFGEILAGLIVGSSSTGADRGSSSTLPIPNAHIDQATQCSTIGSEIVLRGGAGTSPTYAQVAESSHRGHSYGGPADARISIPGLVVRGLAWVRDTTGILDLMLRHGIIHGDAKASIYYTPILLPSTPAASPGVPLRVLPGTGGGGIGAPSSVPSGVLIESVRVDNTSYEPITIAQVRVNLFAGSGDTPYSRHIVHPYISPHFTCVDVRPIAPGDSLRLYIAPFPVASGTRATVEIMLSTATHRFGTIVQELRP